MTKNDLFDGLNDMDIEDINKIVNAILKFFNSTSSILLLNNFPDGPIKGLLYLASCFPGLIP